MLHAQADIFKETEAAELISQSTVAKVCHCERSEAISASPNLDCRRVTPHDTVRIAAVTGRAGAYSYWMSSNNMLICAALSHLDYL